MSCVTLFTKLSEKLNNNQYKDGRNVAVYFITEVLMPALDAKFSDLRKRINGIDDIDADALNARITELVAPLISAATTTVDSKFVDVRKRIETIDKTKYDSLYSSVGHMNARVNVLNTRVSDFNAKLTDFETQVGKLDANVICESIHNIVRQTVETILAESAAIAAPVQMKSVTNSAYNINSTAISQPGLETRVAKLVASFDEIVSDNRHRDQNIAFLVNLANTQTVVNTQIQDNIVKTDNRIILRDATLDTHARLIETARCDITELREYCDKAYDDYVELSNYTTTQIQNLNDTVLRLSVQIDEMHDVADMFRFIQQCGRFVWYSLVYGLRIALFGVCIACVMQIYMYLYV